MSLWSAVPCSPPRRRFCALVSCFSRIAAAAAVSTECILLTVLKQGTVLLLREYNSEGLDALRFSLSHLCFSSSPGYCITNIYLVLLTRPSLCTSIMFFPNCCCCCCIDRMHLTDSTETGYSTPTERVQLGRFRCVEIFFESSMLFKQSWLLYN